MPAFRAALRDPETVYRRRWLTLLVLCISLIVITLDNTILNVAIPTLAHAKAEGGLGASASQLQWIVDAYVLVFAGLLLTAGSLGDRFGRYRFLAVGLSVFGIGSGASAFATSPTMLIATPALIGFAVGIVLMAAFFAWELHTATPMLDMHFFENPRFSAASGAITLVFLSLFGTLFLLTQYLQSVLGYSTVKAGAVLLPQAAVLMILAPMSNIWVQRFGNKKVVTTGLLLVTAPLLADN